MRAASTLRNSSRERHSEEALGVMEAVWCALRGKPIEFYPYRINNGTPEILPSSALFNEINAASKDWSSCEQDDLDSVIKLARDSLTEVSKQTEYQDQKATRLLTITTFLIAFAGVLFLKFQEEYPVALAEPITSKSILVLLTYILFAVFILQISLGALVTFHATRMRFKYDPDNPSSANDTSPRSLLFYQAIIRTQPSAWINSWAPGDKSSPDGSWGALKSQYLKNLIGETYLVAAKTADKVRYLEPAQKLLSRALSCLLAWLVLLCITGIAVAPSKPPQGTIRVQLVEPVTLPPASVIVQMPPSAPTPATHEGPRTKQPAQ